MIQSAVVALELLRHSVNLRDVSATFIQLDHPLALEALHKPRLSRGRHNGLSRRVLEAAISMGFFLAHDASQLLTRGAFPLAAIDCLW